MSGPTTVNSTATEADSVIKSIEAALVPVVEGILISQAPVLGLPVIKTIAALIESALMDKIATFIEEGVTFKIIDSQVGGEESSLSAALSNLIAAEKSNNQAAIRIAIQAYQAAQSALVNDDGSAPLD